MRLWRYGRRRVLCWHLWDSIAIACHLAVLEAVVKLAMAGEIEFVRMGEGEFKTVLKQESKERGH